MSLKVRKNPNADLEKKRPLFLFVGLSLSLACAYNALEWRSVATPLQVFEDRSPVYSEQEWVIPITYAAVPEPIKKIDAPRPSQTSLTIVPNNAILPSLDPSLLATAISDELVEIIDPEPVVDEVYSFVSVESRPVFRGCESIVLEEERFDCFQTKLLHFISSQFRISEQMSTFSQSEKVFVEFIIEKDGTVSNAKAVRGQDELIIEESERLIKSLPPFLPAEINGKPVRMSYVVPIYVKLGS